MEIPRTTWTLLTAMGLAIWGASLVMSQEAPPKSRETPKRQKSEPVEPPLEFVLEIDGKPVPLELDEPTSTEVGGQSVPVKLSVRPYRTFERGGVRFRYPNHYEFEDEEDAPGVSMWTFTGNDNTLMLFKYPKEEPEAALKAMVDATLAQHGKRGVKQAACTLKLSNRELTGKRIDVSNPDAFLRQELFAFAEGDSTYLLVIQDTPEANRKTTPETTAATRMLSESFEFVGTTTPAKPRRGR